MRRESTEIKFFLENLISGWKQNDETEFFPENSVSFSHNSVACAVRTLQFVLFKQALRYTHYVRPILWESDFWN